MKNTLHLRSPAQQKTTLQRIIDKSRILAVGDRPPPGSHPTQSIARAIATDSHDPGIAPPQTLAKIR
ncbi:hypothetical protein [Microcoleus sp. bin38.metabat.b11b12b14.051]|uniref:hypothetical protein n=1 Tax=Microcoleus sp. bin38.metabat.b11b12b14.051 TaxID=2742709 RepID=UPI0025DD0896|nr:hypothetical protein [Microcoleus sp. bin38.metabat.b11b12b14.051]